MIMCSKLPSEAKPGPGRQGLLPTGLTCLVLIKLMFYIFYLDLNVSVLGRDEGYMVKYNPNRHQDNVYLINLMDNQSV